MLNPIGNKLVSVNELLTFEIIASDSDLGDALNYTTSDLPEGAAFHTTTVPPTFNWMPTAGQAGTYQVTFIVMDSCGLLDLETIVITVTELDADFMASETSGCKPLTVCFTDLSVGDIDSWLWSFGDGSASTEASPCHTYTTVGDYTVSLEVSGPNGIDAKIRVTVQGV